MAKRAIYAQKDNDLKPKTKQETNAVNKVIHIIGLVLLSIKVTYEWHVGEIQLTTSNIDGSKGTLTYTLFMAAQLAAIGYLLLEIFIKEDSSGDKE